MKRLIYIIIFLNTIVLYSQTVENIPNDSTEIIPKDSTVTVDSSDTKAEKDTVIRVPHLEHGRISILSKDDALNISKEEIIKMHYNDLYDILEQELVAYPLDLGEYGQNSNFSVMGGMPQSNAVLLNGRPLKNPQYGNMNFSEIAPEFIENIQVFYGSDAAIMGDNSSGALINIQEKRYNIDKPYTRIWFAQSGFNFIGADGIFSQNFLPEWNISLGFRNLKAAGQYNNSNLNSWNVRGILRYSPSDRTTISLSENFTNHKIGLNGGINTQESVDLATGEPEYYDELAAVTNFDALDERNFRHDLTLLFSNISEDTSRVITASLFFSDNKWIRGFDSDSIYRRIDTNYHTINSYNYGGLKLSYEQEIGSNILLNSGLLSYYQSSPADFFLDSDNSWPISAYGRLKFNLSKSIDITGGMRYLQKDLRTAMSFGGAAIFKINSSKLKLDASYSERLPYAFEGLNLKKEKHLLAFLNFSSSNFSANAFIRMIGDPIEAINDSTSSNIISSTHYNAQQRVIGGVYLKFSAKLFEGIFSNTDNMGIKVWGQSNYMMDGSDYLELPLFYGGVDVKYHIEVGRSEMWAGIEVNAFTNNNLPHYLPLNHSWTYSSFNNDASYNGIRAYATLRLGTAWVKLSYDNILSYGYYIVPMYPQLSGNFRLQVAWAFLD